MNPNLVRSTGAADSRALATLRIDVIADLVCPWCWLGKRRLDDALLAVHGPSEVSWYPFRVDPEPSGRSFRDYVASRLDDRKSLESTLETLALAGRAEGIRFRFEAISSMPSTVDAHCVLKLAEAEGLGVSAVAEHLFRGFFEEGLNIADRDTLIELGSQAGLARLDVRRMLDNDATRQAVLRQEAQIRKSGITGVPDFLINKRLFVIGAQGTDALVNVFDRAMFGEESDQPVSSVVH